VKGTTRARHIWLLDVKTKEVRQFTNSSKTEDTPRWSPDGKRLAFISNRDDVRQIYTIPDEWRRSQAPARDETRD
jgi:Tol biopolymer transport system component